MFGLRCKFVKFITFDKYDQSKRYNQAKNIIIEIENNISFAFISSSANQAIKSSASQIFFLQFGNCSMPCQLMINAQDKFLQQISNHRKYCHCQRCKSRRRGGTEKNFFNILKRLMESLCLKRKSVP